MSFFDRDMGLLPPEEEEMLCAGCGLPVEGDDFIDNAWDHICGDCVASTFQECVRGSEVVFLGDGKFMVCSKD